MDKKKILVIEDESDQVMMMQTRLEANGFDVISASNGEDGMKKAYSERPDLILLDLIMPKMSGYEVCRRLKSDPEVRNIPVLVITAVVKRDIDRHQIEMCADGVVEKPYDSAEFIQLVQDLINLKKK